MAILKLLNTLLAQVYIMWMTTRQLKHILDQFLLISWSSLFDVGEGIEKTGNDFDRVAATMLGNLE